MEDVKIREWLSGDFGPGYGYGSGSGYSYGSGYGDGYGDSLFNGSLNGCTIYNVDSVPTIIKTIKGTIAHGMVVGADLTLTDCYIAKGRGFFAHGETVREAVEALENKILESLEPEEAIAEFIKNYPTLDTLELNQDLYDWHHRLTGSCKMGRDKFQKAHGLSLDGRMTVGEFIELTKDAYGGDIIKKLKEKYDERD